VEMRKGQLIAAKLRVEAYSVCANRASSAGIACLVRTRAASRLKARCAWRAIPSAENRVFLRSFRIAPQDSGGECDLMGVGFLGSFE
jgi:hypothetical protein